MQLTAMNYRMAKHWTWTWNWKMYIIEWSDDGGLWNPKNKTLNLSQIAFQSNPLFLILKLSEKMKGSVAIFNLLLIDFQRIEFKFALNSPDFIFYVSQPIFIISIWA